MSSIETLFSELKQKLSPASRDQLDRLRHSPEADALFGREAEETTAERTALVATLSGLPTKYAALHGAAEKQIVADAAEVETARAALRAAEAKLAASQGVGNQHETHERNERFEAERTLRETADPRLAQFAGDCADLEQLANSAFHARVALGGKDWMGRQSAEWVTNGAVVTAARDALKAASADARAMQLIVLDRQEVSDRLNSHIHQLEPMLEPMRLFVLTLDVHGNLSRERSRKTADMLKDAISSTGGRADREPTATAARAPKVFAGLPRVRRARQQLDALT